MPHSRTGKKARILSPQAVKLMTTNQVGALPNSTDFVDKLKSAIYQALLD